MILDVHPLGSDGSQVINIRLVFLKVLLRIIERLLVELEVLGLLRLKYNIRSRVIRGHHLILLSLHYS